MIISPKKITLTKPFVTQSGEVIESPEVCYEEYGNQEGPVIYIAHGGLSNAHAAGKYSQCDLESGWWDPIIGSGKVIDTDKFRVICANSLGSMFGTTGPISINPETGKKYGPQFPEISLIDMVCFIKLFLEQLGVEKLHLMAGPSMGSLQSLQMAALFPDFVENVVAVATAGRMPPSGLTMHHFMMNAVRMDPEYKGGWYEEGEARHSLRIIHQVAKLYYTHEKCIKTLCWDSVEDGEESQQKRNKNISNYLLSTLDDDIAGRDPNSYITLTTAVNGFDLGIGTASYEEGARRIKCPVMLINIDTDCEFAPQWAHELGDVINQANPGQCRVEIIKSEWGHLGCLREADTIADLMQDFLG
ncbi:MAG: alpha/beta fold hydrolase [Gammaproteobacteria bacterium]|nr:MAG: alpha/beta fold hydrolase [Gammaproteobacteria bacterium]